LERFRLVVYCTLGAVPIVLMVRIDRPHSRVQLDFKTIRQSGRVSPYVKRLACAVFGCREQSGDYKITALMGTAQSTFCTIRSQV
jgi:hypothetical protein